MVALTPLSTSSDSVSSTLAQAVEHTISISISAVLSIQNNDTNSTDLFNTSTTTTTNMMNCTHNSTMMNHTMSANCSSSSSSAHNKHCKGMKPHSHSHSHKTCPFLQINKSGETNTTVLFTSSPSLLSSSSSSHNFFHNSTWLPFTAWLMALLFITVAMAFLVYRFLLARSPTHGEYEELYNVDPPVAVKFQKNDGNAGNNNNNNNNSQNSKGGNASRQRFLESRRAAAQKSYGTADSAP
ncbi:uncharacterized protein TM35_000112940 [Trypanosoma theileri]|uniref:Uncharacterized protein n=1 Tax=Trypanosoma theileri TaxID=67003 RepID=A0A1X0P029_9TRYP|nr:uncharacterized protein TM35_000112940 [Trypanosoma theileri]ORC89760.1 hypothetical protein TM35_000112940 [Trypanosoma theileri]